MKSRTVQAHVPYDLHKALKVLAAQEDATLSGLIRQMIVERVGQQRTEYVARHDAAPAQR